MDSAFWHGVTLKNFIFESVNIDSTAGLIGACVVVALVAFAFEGLRTFRDWLYLEFLRKRSCHGTEAEKESSFSLSEVKSKPVLNGQVPTERQEEKNANNSERCDEQVASTSVETPIPNGSPVIATGTISGVGKNCKRADFHVGVLHLFSSTFFHMCQVCLGYFLMLAVMTFNVYIFVAVLAGTSIGFFLFDSFNKKIHALKMNAADKSK